MTWPNPDPNPLPGPPTVADVVAIARRYALLKQARADADLAAVALLTGACADDVPHLLGELARAERLRQELAGEVDRLRRELGATRPGVYWPTDAAYALTRERFNSCAYPGDHEHDHRMCQDAIAERFGAPRG